MNLPLGLFVDTEFKSAVVPLEPGDRLVLVTDGMPERGAEKIDLPRAIRRSAGLHPREAAAGLADDVLAATGHALSDDATVLCLDWYGGHGRERTTSAGPTWPGPASACADSDGRPWCHVRRASSGRPIDTPPLRADDEPGGVAHESEHRDDRR